MEGGRKTRVTSAHQQLVRLQTRQNAVRRQNRKCRLAEDQSSQSVPPAILLQSPQKVTKHSLILYFFWEKVASSDGRVDPAYPTLA